MADVAVFARRDDDPFASLVAAREEDVLLVVVDGRPLYGTKEHLARAGGRRASSVAIGRRRRRVVITDPADGDEPEHERGKWFFSRVTANLGEVRRDPRATLDAPLASAELDPSAPAAPPSLQLSLDMPGGPGIEAGPPPPDVEVVIPPIPSLHHDRSWLRSLHGRGFHRGVLDGLADFYP